MSDSAQPIYGLRIIVEETVQRVYDFDTEAANFGQELYYETVTQSVFDPSRGPVPPELKKRAKKGGAPVKPPSDLKLIGERTVTTAVTVLDTKDGVPFREVKRTPTTVTSKPVKA